MNDEDPKDARRYGADLVLPAAASLYAIYYVASVWSFPPEAQRSGLFLAGLLLTLTSLFFVRSDIGARRRGWRFDLSPLLRPHDGRSARLTFMIALYSASHLGGGISAILLNIPGAGGAAATTLDGFPMAQKGQAAKALALSFVASVLGGLITSALTLFLLPYLSQVGFYIRSVEMVVVMLFGLALIAAIAAQDMLKGLIAGAFGLMLGAMGADHIYATPRGTFGLLELFDGVPLVPALVGLFAVSEALVMLEGRGGAAASTTRVTPTWRETFGNIFGAFRHWWLIAWTGLLGLVIGVLPGAGASIAAFVAYQQARMFSRTPEKFGTGHPQGVVAPESANNGVTTGTLAPLLAIGIPVGSTAAVMTIVLQYHGVPFGPRLFMLEPLLAYGVIMSMVVSYLLMLVTVFPMVRYLSGITAVATCYMAPLIERSFLLAMRISGNDLSVMVSSTIGNILWAMLAVTLIAPPVLARRARLRARD